MFGIIATIIAAKKGHSGYAIFTGIWTAIAIILALTAGPQYGFGPGILFMFIAIGMKDERKNDETAKATAESNVPEVRNQHKFVCTACGNFSTGWYQTCPHCGAVGKMERSRETGPSQTQTDLLPAGPDEAYSIRWTAGPLAGQKTVVHGQMTIGRSEDNTIVLPANTAGVSGRHCAITVANGQFYIADLGSTCGTVGNGAHRLPPNQAVILKAGDRICLGSDQVAFEVSK